RRNFDSLFNVFFFSSGRRHTRFSRDWSSACALPIYARPVLADQRGDRQELRADGVPELPEPRPRQQLRLVVRRGEPGQLLGLRRDRKSVEQGTSVTTR